MPEVLHSNTLTEPITLPTSTMSTTVATCSNPALSAGQNKILQLESLRRTNLQKLAELKNRKCAYLKAAAELKVGPYLVNELKMLLVETRYDDVKAKTFGKFINNAIVNNGKNSIKAIKEVQEYIDQELEKKKLNNQ